jgi:SAM-dependent methyltransferase
LNKNFSEGLQEIAIGYHLNPNVQDKNYDKDFHVLLGKLIRQRHPSANNILELGFGEGTVAQEFFPSFSGERIVLEGSFELSEIAQVKLGESARVINKLFEEFETNTKFDLILATNILEHVENPIAILNQIYSWLTEDGVCIITVPNSESIHRRLAVAIGIQIDTKVLSARDNLVGHLRVYDLEMLESEISQAKLNVVYKEGLVIKFLNNKLQDLLPHEVSLGLQEISGDFPIEMTANLYVEVKKCIL